MGNKNKSFDELLAKKANRTQVGKLVKTLNKQLDYMYKKEIEEKIIKKAIEDFYDDYPPHLYKRKYSLRKAYKFTVKNGCYTIDFNYRYMKKHHRASNAYIYNLAFISGYHGGATSISEKKINKWDNLGINNRHPSPAKYYGGDIPISGGTPYYRTPPKPGVDENGVWRPKYYQWGEPAEKSEPPFKKIIKEIHEYEKTIPDKKKIMFKNEFIKWLYD